MPNELIRPNWHVILIHFPLALLGIGLLIEIFSFLWRGSSFRVAGRWMILLGALLSVPAATSGIYAFRDVVAPGEAEPHDAWYDVAAASHWNAEQWGLMRHHVIYASAGTGVLILGVLGWLAVSDESRRRLHWPLVVVGLVGMGCLMTASWYSGEAIYRHGTAVELPGKENPELQGHQHATHTDTHEAEEKASDEGGAGFDIEQIFPPMQVHVLLAGLAVAGAVASLGLSVHWWNREYRMRKRERVDELAREIAPAPGGEPSPAVNVTEGRAIGEEPEATAIVGNSPRMPFPARFWLITLVLGAATFVSGLWLANDWQFSAWGAEGWQDEYRLGWHLVMGVALAALLLVLPVVTRFFRRFRLMGYGIGLLLVLAFAFQLWLGILMLYDSTSGGVFAFQKPGETERAPAASMHKAGGAAARASTAPAAASAPATTRPAP